MEILLNSTAYVELRRPGQAVGDMKKAGFRNAMLELDICSGVGDFLFTDRARKDSEENGFIFIPDDPSRIAEKLAILLDTFKKNGIDLPVAHATRIGFPEDGREPDRDLYFRVLEEEVRFAAKLGCRAIVVSPFHLQGTDEEVFEYNRQKYLRLAEIANEVFEKGTENCGSHPMKILLENQYKPFEGHLVRGMLSDTAEIIEWLDRLNHDAKHTDAFGFCLNIGHCNVCGQDIYEFAYALKGRIDAVMLYDNDGHNDDTMVPFTSIAGGRSATNWHEVIKGLRSISFDGYLIMDIGSTAANFPIILMPELLSLVYRLAEYFKWQIQMADAMKKYDHVVLFGAGNMCRNYMKNYGEQYPPLFTCDNNSARWGEEFCGLTIESPERLKSLPENTGIFICNVYYREIEKQLRDMGITESVEYFNDEYLQTFYMDRLKGL